jgi:DNA-binding NarL/FixJ family response regulator
MDKIRILVAEDEAITRIAFVHFINTQTDYSAAGEAGDGFELVDLYFKTRPDIVLCDIRMPGMNGLDASERILSRDKSAKIIFLTAYEDEDHLCSAIRIGAWGYLCKNLLWGGWSEVVQKVYAGEKYFLGRTESEIGDLKRRCRGGDAGKLHHLTIREKEIAHLVAEGMTSDEISKRLSISKRTVDCHRLAINEKLGVSKRSEIVDLLKNRG